MIIHTMPINELIEFFKIKTRMNLYKLTDEELIDLIENVAFENIYHITQWDEFIDFVQYVKGEYNEKKQKKSSDNLYMKISKIWRKGALLSVRGLQKIVSPSCKRSS